MSPALTLAENKPHQFDGEIEIFVEFPKSFDGENVFLNFTGESGVNGFYRSDPVAIEFLSGTVSGEIVIEPRGLPDDASDETKSAFEQSAGEMMGQPNYLHQQDVDRLLGHHDISPDELNPVLQCAIVLLKLLATRYGDECRIVYWLHQA